MIFVCVLCLQLLSMSVVIDPSLMTLRLGLGLHAWIHTSGRIPFSFVCSLEVVSCFLFHSS